MASQIEDKKSEKLIGDNKFMNNNYKPRYYDVFALGISIVIGGKKFKDL